MKVIKEEFKNVPKTVTTVADVAMSQAIADGKEYDRRKARTAKEISVDLPLDGAPKAEKPKTAVVPDPLKESLAENINETDAARIVQETVKNSFGIDVDVATYKDSKDSKCVIVEFVASKADCKKMPYDELKEKLYQRFGTDINISSKQFSSPNLKNKGTEYKLKLFVLKEKKDKSKIYAESLKESVNAAKVQELSKALGRKLTEEQADAIKDRWWGFYNNPTKFASMVKLVIEDLVDLKILNEAISLNGTQPYIVVTFPDSLISASGINKIEGKGDVATRNARRIALRDYINNNFDVTIPGSSMKGDKGEAISFDAKTGKWSSKLFGTKEGLQDFMDATGIDAKIKVGAGPQDWIDAGIRDEENAARYRAAKELGLDTTGMVSDDLDAYDRIWNDLSADCDHEQRRIPAINADLKTAFKQKLQFWPNENRYRSEDSQGAESNLGSDVEITPSADNMKIIITPSGTTRKGDERNFDFAFYVAKVYEDYGAKFTVSETPDKKGRKFGIMSMDERWIGVDTDEHEAQIRNDIKTGKLVIPTEA